MENQNYNQNYYRNINREYDQRNVSGGKKNNNTWLVVMVAILAAVAIVGSIVLLVVVNQKSGEQPGETAAPTQSLTVEPAESEEAEATEEKPIPVGKTMYADCDVSITFRTSPSVNASEICQIPVGDSLYVIEYTNEEFAKVIYNERDGYVKRAYLSNQKTTVSVQQTMYVDCNESVTFRTGPGTDYAEIMQILVGEEVYVTEYVNNGFAKITYNGTNGYVMKDYLSNSRPYVWEYNEAEVEAFVASSLREYIYAVNTGETGDLYRYFSGSILETEKNNAEKAWRTISGAELLRVECHSVKRISKNRITVIRESTIRIRELSENYRDATEQRKYTIENTGSGMYIVNIEKV